MSYNYVKKAIENNEVPITKNILEEKIKSINIQEGDTIIVHASLSSLGYIIGGAEAIFDALLSAIGREGTIVVPSQTVEISDPSTWEYPPVPKEWFEIIKEGMPAFNIDRSYSKAMGEFSNFVRMLPDSIRSNHPMYSFCAYGKLAKKITENHKLDFPFGKASPLERLYNLNSKVIMIGTDFDTNTSIHLAENYLNREVIQEKSKMKIDGKDLWISFNNIDLDIYDDYLDIQEAFVKEYEIKSVEVGNSKIESFNMRECVDFVKNYYEEKGKNYG